MWDNAPLLRSIAGALFFCSVLAMLYGAAHYVVHLPKLLPVKSVRLNEMPARVVAEDVQSVVRQRVQGNFLTVDIDNLRQSLEKLPWVRNVSIRREFPDHLLVQFEEHKALAHWNDVALVNQQGEVFEAETTEALPRFTGYEGTSGEVLKQYAIFSQQLHPLNLRVMQLALSSRHAWQLHLSNGMVVELGREAMEQRLARFVAIYPYIMVQGGTSAQGIQVVDMRYRDGFAVTNRHGRA
jgi:cell division protein FtsQ